LRAAGNAVAVAGEGAAATAAAGLAAATGAAVAVVAAAAVAFASVSITAITSRLCTVAPLGATISTSTPAAGAGSSSTTLSVSTSIRFSSRPTASPGCLCQLTSVASATDSGSWGTLTSTRMMALSYQVPTSISPSDSLGAKASSISCFCWATCFDM
jgi:hypothetical protein